ncbi:7273_t:CDS:2 [Diversispora eburnea]|uniref:7273_t:CDS:1 n=1 Tax=Diversispora eburnea TaxID=1213867 RepID=A0A9N8VGE9_9GLOM|nr:7273_t:CDS:2 [Diversispora eburnea]
MSNFISNSRIVHEVFGQFNKSEPLAYILKEILCAKAIIRQTLNIVKTKNNVDIENFLDEQDGYHIPPRAVDMPKTFITLELNNKIR